MWRQPSPAPSFVPGCADSPLSAPLAYLPGQKGSERQNCWKDHYLPIMIPHPVICTAISASGPAETPSTTTSEAGIQIMGTKPVLSACCCPWDSSHQHGEIRLTAPVRPGKRPHLWLAFRQRLPASSSLTRRHMIRHHHVHGPAISIRCHRDCGLSPHDGAGDDL